MKFVASLIALIATASALESHVELTDMKADSKLGQKLLQKARNLEEMNMDYGADWVAGYSLKFQGCHHISQWNDEADGEDDVRIATKRLVRFRLCPSNSCSSSSSAGCSNGFGDYIIDLEEYLESYFQAKQEYQEFQCEYLTNYACGCEDNGDDEEYNEDKCLWDCFKSHNMQGICMENNPYQEDGYGQNQNQYNFDVADYMQCNQANLNNNNNNNGNNNKLYIGPYCASQGGAIYLGAFMDDSCTTFADDNGGRSVFKSLTGQDLPYGSSNVIDMDCFSCKEPVEKNNDGNDAYDADEVAEVCERLYDDAGKCEKNLPSGTVYYPNNNACNYMEGIKIVRKDGSVITAEARANKTASVFIGIFVVAFVLLTAYVYYLKTKLDRASINLSD